MQMDPIKHLVKRSLQLLALAVGLLLAAHSAHAQYPSFQQSLLNERVGFGANATGGAGGEIYWVTNLNDSGPGSLRQACEQDDNARWILFAVDGTIDIPSIPIQVHSNKTIDARGASITITSHGLWILTFDSNGQPNGSRNVIVENVNFSNGFDDRFDAVMMQEGAGDVWVDHCTFTNWIHNAMDVSAPRASAYSDVTISWCRFNPPTVSGINHTPILLGATPTEPWDENMRVTLHHNFFFNPTHRSPMGRKGKFHAFNNYLYNWYYYGMASYESGQLYTENNIFYAVRDRDAVIVDDRPQEPYLGFAKNVNNLKLGGAVTVDYNAAAVFNPSSYYSYAAFLETANTTLQSKLATSTGATRTSGTLANMSTRANVQGGQGNLISGFTISGSPSDTKRVIIRALGPSLSAYFSNAMGNPTLSVYDVYANEIASNDDWTSSSQASEIQATGLAPSNNLEAAWVGYLAPGTYSAAINGWGTGIAVLEIYDLDASAAAKLTNISSRTTVDPSNPTVAGFITQSGWTKLLIRGIGPSLAQFGIQNPISDPTLTLYDANGTQIDYNNNWQDAPSGASQLGFAPSDWREAVIATNLAPGAYTVILRDYFNNWGIGSIEMYKF
jgi:pectate lyase